MEENTRNYDYDFVRKTKNGQELPIHIFEPKGEVKGNIQFLYGITSNAEKYPDFINYFTDNGYRVFCCDLIGHGKNDTKIDQAGNVFKETVKQQLLLNKYLAKQELPLGVVAHSYGGFLVLDMMKSKEFSANGVALTSIGDMRNMQGKVTHAFLKCRTGRLHKTIDAVMQQFGKLVFTGKPLPIDITLNPYVYADLSNRYTQDSLYNFEINKENLKDIPIKLLAGESDRLTGGGKGTEKLQQELQSFDMNAECSIYPEGHHLLSEGFKDGAAPLAVEDIVDFIDSACAQNNIQHNLKEKSMVQL